MSKHEAALRDIMKSINPAYDPRAVEAVGIIREEYNVARREVEELRVQRDRLHVNQLDLLRERDKLISERDRAEGNLTAAVADIACLRRLLSELVQTGNALVASLDEHGDCNCEQCRARAGHLAVTEKLR